MIIRCDACGTHVMPTRDGVCPCCRSTIPQAPVFSQIPDDGDTTSNAEAVESEIDGSDTLGIPGCPDHVGFTDDIPVPIGDSDLMVRFREAWRSGVPDIRDFLPVCDDADRDSVRLAYLCEFIEHDLHARGCPGKLWLSTLEADTLSQPAPNGFRLQDYIEQFPELGTFAALPTRLIAAEFRARLVAGDAPQLNEYTTTVDAARIPEITDAILAVLNEKTPPRPVLCKGLRAVLGRTLQFFFFSSVIGGQLRRTVDPGDSLPAVFMFVISGIAALLVALISMGKFHPHEVRSVLGWRKPSLLHGVVSLALAIPLYLLASSTAAITLTGWNAGSVLAIDWSPYYMAYAELAREPMWVLILVGCLLPAVAEEIFFRAFMGRGLIRAYGTVGGVLLTSLIFGLFHVRPGHVVFAFFFGIALHCVYLTTKSIFAPMILHTMNNLIAFTELRWIQSEYFNPTQDDSSYIPFGLLMISIVTAVLLAQLLRKTRSRWVVAGDRTWTPGFVSAEMPPALIPAEMVGLKTKPSLKIFATVSYVALLAGIGMTVNSWIGLTHANAALNKIDAGNVALADQYSKQAIAQAPHLAWIHGVRAFVLMEMRDFPSAKESCASAMKLDTQIGLAYRVLGWITYQEHQNQAAIDHCSKAIRLNHNDAFAYAVRGAAEFALNDHDSAILDATEAIRRDPTAALAFSVRGAARTERGQLDPAKKDLSRAIELNPALAFAWTYRAQVRYELKDFAGAIDEARKALELDPNDGHSHYFLGLALQETQQYDLAIESYSTYLEISEGDDGVRKQRAELQLRQQRAPEAIADLDILIQRYPEDEQLYLLRSQALRMMGDVEKARLDDLQIERISKAAQIERAWTLINGGQCNDAITLICEALIQFPSSSELYSARAAAKWNLGELENAIADYSLALEFDPRNTDTLQNRGNLYFEVQNYSKAISDFTRAIDINSDLVGAFLSRGRAYEARGDQSQADADFETATELQRLQE